MTKYTDIHRRMRVFNDSLFDTILSKYSKGNAEWHDTFIKSNFERVFKKAAKDDDVTLEELKAFEEKYQFNLKLLSEKDLSKDSGTPD